MRIDKEIESSMKYSTSWVHLMDQTVISCEQGVSAHGRMYGSSSDPKSVDVRASACLHSPRLDVSLGPALISSQLTREHLTIRS